MSESFKVLVSLCFKNLNVCFFRLQYNAVPPPLRPGLWKQSFIVFCLMNPIACKNRGSPGQTVLAGTKGIPRVQILPSNHYFSFSFGAEYFLQEEKCNSSQSLISTGQAQLFKFLNYKKELWKNKYMCMY